MGNTYPTKNINKHCCSAGCFGAFRWQGMTTNGGCRCLQQVKDLKTRKQIRLIIQAYQDRIKELEERITYMGWELNPDRMGQ